MATIYDVCKLAGVSMATVSRVINGNENVRKTTRQKVLDAMAELGYKPSRIAQSLASRMTNSIGLQVSELSGPFYGPMMVGIENELQKNNKQVFITSGHSDAEREKAGIESLLSRSCDALILHVEAVDDDYLIELAEGSTPFVLLNRYIEEIADHCIVLDNFKGGYLAAQYLIEQGHSSIAYISGPLWKDDASARYAGHLKALKDAGIEENTRLLYEGDFHEEAGMQGLRECLATKEPFTAVACANDEMASGALAEAREAGIRVPDELSVIGFDDINVAYYLHPKLTTIRYPIEEMAGMAARWVLNKVYGGKYPIANTFVPTLVERNSTAKLKHKVGA